VLSFRLVVPILSGQEDDMTQGDLKEKDNGKWVFWLDEAGTESREFDTRGEAEVGAADFIAAVKAGNEKAAVAAEELAKEEAEADYQRRLQNFNAIKKGGHQFG
jgi:hypothetical protein